MTEPELSTFDRSTLGAWRVGNIVGWSLGALVVAVVVSFGANSLFVDVLDAAIDPFTGGSVVPAPIELIGSGLLVGGSIGLVIGSRVYRARIWVAVAVTVIFLVITPFAFLAAMGTGPVWATLGTMSYVVAAGVVAWLFDRKLKR